MLVWRTLAVSLSGLALAGCAATPPSSTQSQGIVQNIEFMRGCWVQKDEPGGRILGFLRVLPNDAETYRGQISHVDDNTMRPVVEFLLARDGSYVELPYKDATLRLPAERFASARRGDEASFQTWPPGEREPLIFQAGAKDEKLMLNPGGHIFNMVSYERDGCD